MTGDKTMAEILAALDVSRTTYAGLETRLAARQGKRRGAILAGARELFNEGGSRLVTLRRLVSRGGATAPTIYHLVGNCDAVLEQALLEHHEICIGLAPMVALCLNLNVVNGFAETLWLSTQAQPHYARRMILLLWQDLEGRRLGKVFGQRTIEAIQLWVRDLCGRSRLAKRVGHDNLAAAMEAQIRVALLDWAQGADSALTLRRKLARASSICLLRFVDEEVSGRIAGWLEELGRERGVEGG